MEDLLQLQFSVNYTSFHNLFCPIYSFKPGHTTEHIVWQFYIASASTKIEIKKKSTLIIIIIIIIIIKEQHRINSLLSKCSMQLRESAAVTTQPDNVLMFTMCTCLSMIPRTLESFIIQIQFC